MQLIKTQITKQNVYNPPHPGSGTFTQSVIFEDFCHSATKIKLSKSSMPGRVDESHEATVQVRCAYSEGGLSLNFT